MERHDSVESEGITLKDVMIIVYIVACFGVIALVQNLKNEKTKPS